MSEFDTKVPTAKKSEINHLNRQIPPESHTPMYVWHKFWSRKTWNVVGEFIKTYSKEDEVVFDPFAGSGVTATEALRNKRRVIVCDLLPIATEIIRLTIKPVSETQLYNAFKRVEAKVRDKILSLYETHCRKCVNEFPFTCAIWDKGNLVEIRYQKCPKCGDRREKNTVPTNDDLKLVEELNKKEIKEWYPQNPLYYPDGSPFMKKEKSETLADLFTKRNLQGLAWLIETIEEEKDKELKDFLKVGLTSVVHLCSKLLAEGRTGYRPFSGVGWNQQSYWCAPRNIEANVWEKFDGAINGA